MCKFEEKVLNGLFSCINAAGITEVPERLRIGVAVSGGADSISLLTAFSEIFKQNPKLFSDSLYVITVNHNIRPAEESGGDAKFVCDYCGLLAETINVSCKIVELEPGKVNACSIQRQQGIEDAARFLRYEAFEHYIADNKLDYLCLAHNKNDQLETVLMRFLSGSGVEAAGGIKAARGKFLRPLLSIEREEIEEYLTEKGLSWRTDSTNLDTSYFRNKVRHKLVPFLQENFPLWQQSVLSGAEKNAMDGALIEHCVENFELKVNNQEVEIPCNDFFALEPAVQYRVLIKACNLCGETKRIPYPFLKDFLMHKTGKKVFHNIEIFVKNNSILVKKYVKTHTELVFSDIIYKEGNYQFPFGVISVFEGSKAGFVNIFYNETTGITDVELPVCIRCVQTDDEIECADGKMKKVNDVFSDWHVPLEQKCFIPVIQKLNSSKQEIVGIFGGVCGFNNWIVYEKVNNQSANNN